METRKVILYISMSLDGFIATANDDLSFLDKMQVPNEDYGYHALSEKVDTYIVGRKTYSVIKKLVGDFPQAKQYSCFVITRQDLPNLPNITFYNGNIEQLICQLKAQKGKHIYCDGGGEIVQLLMDKDLIDEYIISVVPTILGHGKRLFLGHTNAQDLHFLGATTYKTGLVQLHYTRNRTA